MSTPDTNAQIGALDDVLDRQRTAGARAVGLLSALIATKTMPAANLASAIEIVAQFDDAWRGVRQ